MVVLGGPLRKISIYASITMVLDGREHDLSVIVVSCIEELYRTGLYQSNLFRTFPNRSRLLGLINISDSTPGSIIRSKQSLPLENPAKSGFGASTSPINLSLGSTRTYSPSGAFPSDMGLGIGIDQKKTKWMLAETFPTSYIFRLPF